MVLNRRQWAFQLRERGGRYTYWDQWVSQAKTRSIPGEGQPAWFIDYACQWLPISVKPLSSAGSNHDLPLPTKGHWGIYDERWCEIDGLRCQIWALQAYGTLHIRFDQFAFPCCGATAPPWWSQEDCSCLTLGFYFHWWVLCRCKHRSWAERWVQSCRLP